jgi:hypothetical protein
MTIYSNTSMGINQPIAGDLLELSSLYAGLMAGDFMAGLNMIGSTTH